jgi:hypothetical protein
VVSHLVFDGDDSDFLNDEPSDRDCLRTEEFPEAFPEDEFPLPRAENSTSNQVATPCTVQFRVTVC